MADRQRWPARAAMAIVVLFPDGHLPGPRYRFPASLIAASPVAACVMSSMAGGIEMQPKTTEPREESRR